MTILFPSGDDDAELAAAARSARRFRRGNATQTRHTGKFFNQNNGHLAGR
jgi:hypothetical protein